MELAAALRNRFSHQDRARGEAYFSRGMISQPDAQGEVALFHCQGNSPRGYRVALDFSPQRAGRVGVWCSCLRFDDGFPCKHLWAAVRQLSEDPTFQRRFQGSLTLQAMAAAKAEALFARASGNGPASAAARSLATAESPVPPRPSALSASLAAWKAHAQRHQSTWSPHSLAPLVPTDPLDGVQWRLVIELSRCGDFRHAVLGLYAAEPHRKTGQLKAIKARQLSRATVLQCGDPAMRRALALLTGGERVGGAWAYGFVPQETLALTPDLAAEIVPSLAASGQFGWWLGSAAGATFDDVRPLRWDGDGSWRFELALVPAGDAADTAGWRLTGRLVRGDEVVAMDDVVAVFASGLVLHPDRLAPFAPADFAWAQTCRSANSIVVEVAQLPELFAQLSKMPGTPALALPPELASWATAGCPRGRLSIDQPADGARGRLTAGASAVYEGQAFSFTDVRRYVWDPAAQRLVIRDPSAEQALLTTLRQLPLELSIAATSLSSDCRASFPAAKLPEVAARLVADDWEVLAAGLPLRSGGVPRIAVTSGQDWFDVTAAVDFGDQQAPLPELLAAVRRKSAFVLLGDGSVGMLPTQWLERFAALGQAAPDDEQAALRFGRAGALLVDALLEQVDASQVEVDAQFAQTRARLQQFQGVRPLGEPRGFQGKLREYQRLGLGWFKFLRDFGFGGCLADDMGLGKTVQVLALLQSRRLRRVPAGESRRPSIVVVPRTLVFNWLDEAQRFAPRLRVHNHTGLGRELPDEEAYDVLLTTYGTLRRDLEELAQVQFDYAVLDEAQAIKNAHSQAAQACRQLQAVHRLAMTGTPIENHLGELWSLMEFLNPGLLGTARRFRGWTASQNGESTDLEGLRRGLAPMMLRRTKAQVLKQLPGKTEQSLVCDLTPRQREQYDQLRDHYRDRLTKRVAEVGLKRAKIHVLEALLRLRQAACDPRLLDPQRGAPGSKLRLLVDHLEELQAEGHKALVFSQFTSLLALVRAEADARRWDYEYLDGKTRDRASRVQRFQDEANCRLFLISLKAGGNGLNLTAADYVFILDPWWNPAVEAQAIDRAHRMGQRKPVTAYRLICRDTVEEKIVELQRTKRELADAIVSANQNVLRSLTSDDLEFLLS